MRKVGEVHHFTAEQVKEHCRQAAAIVDELAPADDLRAPMFAAAAKMLSGKQVFYEQASPLLAGLPHNRG